MADTPQGPHEPVRGSMRIVTVTHYFPAHGGGLEKVAEELVAGLSSSGCGICWFSSDTDAAPPHRHVATVGVPTSNVVEKLTQLPYPLWTPRVIPRLWREIGAAQVVHVHEHLYLPSLLAVLLARLRGRPVVITQHMGALRLGSPVATRLYVLGARLLGALVFRAAAANVFISRNVLEFFRQGHSSRSRMIFNGVDTARFVPMEEESARLALRRDLQLPSGGLLMLFVGRLVRKKGVHRIVALARQFPGVHWVLVGSGPELPREVPPNIVLAGRVEHDRLAAFYQAADVLILPSTGEGMPLVVQEALCCGTGVLSTDEVASACPEASDMIRACPVPVDGDDITDWASAMEALLRDSAYLAPAARAERARRARALWSWERCVAAYRDLFEGLVEVT